MAQPVFTQTAVGRVNKFKVAEIVPNDINGTTVFLLIDPSGNAMNVRVDEKSESLKPGDTIRYFDNNGYANIVNVEAAK